MSDKSLRVYFTTHQDGRLTGQLLPVWDSLFDAPPPSAYGARGLFPFVTFRRDAVARFRQAATAAGIAPGTVIVLETGESWHYYR